MSILTRGLTPEDSAAFSASLERAVAAGELLGSSSPHGEFLVPWSLAEPRLVGVAHVGGTFAGWVHPEVKGLVVEPGFRRLGVGRALVELGRDMEAGRKRPNLLLGALPGQEPAHAFLAATGFELHSLLWDLELPADAAATPPGWPDEVTVRTIRVPDDNLPFVRLFNVTFADHATPLQFDEANLVASAEQLPWKEEDLLVAERGGELVAFCATEPKRPEAGGVEPRAEIWTIGVRPDLQGRGLGRQLLRWGVQHLRGLGVETVTLSVNGRNPRALGLYESEGFVRTSTRERWAKAVPAA